MNKKILIGSIFAALLMLSMPMISNIQAQPAPEFEVKETDECSICPISCDEIENKILDIADKIYDSYDRFYFITFLLSPIMSIPLIFWVIVYALAGCFEQ